MFTKFIALMFFFTSTNFVQAENHLLMFGGGGEPKKDSTIFDNGLANLGKNLNSSNWKYQISFNGGHKNTETIFQNQYSKGDVPTTNFTQANYSNLIESYKNKILSGEIKSGDQLVIIVNSHGAQRSEKEVTHQIAASGGSAQDLNNLSGSNLVSLDKLQEIVKLTNDRGIKLGIIDLTCHSGTSLALKNNAPNTCIVTASGPDHYGYAGPKAFTDRFLMNLKPGTNLEDAFLKSRLESTDSSYPMISTNENDKIVKDVYEGITPYLYYYNAKADKLTPYVLDNGTVSLFCKREDDFEKLITKINELKSVMDSNKNSFNSDKLKDLLFEYKSMQDKVLKTSMKIGSYKLDSVEVFSMPNNSYTNGSVLKPSYTWRELIDFNVDAALSFYEQHKKNLKSRAEKKEYQAVIDFLRTVKARKDQIYKENPQLTTYKVHTTLLVKQMKKSQTLANDIAMQEKIFYEELYRRGQTINPNDPCRKIVF